MRQRNRPCQFTVKVPELTADPPGVVTVILPVVAPAGTVAVTVVVFTTWDVVALVPLNRTEVDPMMFVPVIVTLVPMPPDVGENEVIVGEDETTVKCAGVVIDP